MKEVDERTRKLEQLRFDMGLLQQCTGDNTKALLSTLQRQYDALMEEQRYEESLSAFKSALTAGADGATAEHCKAQAAHILHFHLFLSVRCSMKPRS